MFEYKINRNVTPKNIKLDCEGSLKRLGTDYIDVYQVRTYVGYNSVNS